MKKSQPDTAPANAGAPMPSPFVRDREHESDRRDALLRASPEVTRVRAETEAAVAEADRVAAEARAKLQERENQVEQLRSLLLDERGLVGNLRFFQARQQEIVAEKAAAEEMLNFAALGLHRHDGEVKWRNYIEQTVRLDAEAVQVARVVPIVERGLAELQARRADLQRSLGFKVTGLASDGTLEGSEPEPEPERFEWQAATPGGVSHFRPVAA